MPAAIRPLPATHGTQVCPRRETIVSGAKIADYLASNPDQYLKTMAAEKLNLTEDALTNPVTPAISGSLSTAVGAFIPIVPFFFYERLSRRYRGGDYLPDCSLCGRSCQAPGYSAVVVSSG